MVRRGLPCTVFWSPSEAGSLQPPLVRVLRHWHNQRHRHRRVHQADCLCTLFGAPRQGVMHALLPRKAATPCSWARLHTPAGYTQVVSHARELQALEWCMPAQPLNQCSGRSSCHQGLPGKATAS